MGVDRRPPTGIDLAGVPECVACGCCCFSTNPEYLRVLGVDHDRLGDDAERLTQFIGNRAYMKLEDGHCAALACDPAGGRWYCTIYERRPDVCRWLERGSGQCHAERHEKADRRFASLRRLTVV